jgi:hypothetical protein
VSVAEGGCQRVDRALDAERGGVDHVRRLNVHDGRVAPKTAGCAPGYPLKLNSYDLGVDIELADAIQRVRFEHPEVRALVVTSAKDRIFCSGANIYMLGSSTHPFKVNFCKYTNETRLYLEELSPNSGVPVLARLNGTASGGGYELALACDEILLQDDGNSAVSLPEAPLLAVLPAPAGSPAWSTSARCGATSPTCSRRWPRACAASARWSGAWSTSRPALASSTPR